ncbi:hypothetical protein N7532_009112 [Penicillium argentinense]|uniref:ER membrane protein complex subunit 10 n=1 Tax=Penicillium argentinense TaxID=1131581 RepID=A0A9W9EYP2_9EURO|nr:uncharacterized protein N7532_009112 [Penicillium argentinense]KAJ5090428.1 hypothetical protein N7532_009112 [Penicillium argentinense]
MRSRRLHDVLRWIRARAGDANFNFRDFAACFCPQRQLLTTMHLLALLSFLSLLFVFTLADSLPITSDIFYWPVGSTQPSILARLAYDPSSLTSNVVSYHPPKTDSTDGLVRVGLYTSTPMSAKQWVGSLVSLSALTDAHHHQPIFRLHLGPSNEVYHVSLAASEPDTTSPKVELVSTQPGAQPHLNRPIFVGPDGENPDVVEEKSFLQKYWWVLLIVAFLSMSGGAEGQS